MGDHLKNNLQVGCFVETHQLSIPLSLFLILALFPFLSLLSRLLGSSFVRSLASLDLSFPPIQDRLSLRTGSGSLLALLVLFPFVPTLPFSDDVSNPKVPRAYHPRYRRLVKGFPLSALHHVARWLLPLLVLLAPRFSPHFYLPYRLYLQASCALDVTLHYSLHHVFYPSPSSSFLHFAPKSQFCRVIVLFLRAFVLSAFLAQGTNYDQSLIVYLSPSFIHFLHRIPDILSPSLFLSPLYLFLSSHFSEKYSAFCLAFLLHRAFPGCGRVYFLFMVSWLLFGFLSAACVFSVSLRGLSLLLSLSFSLTILCRLSLSLLSRSAYPTFSHLLVISIDWSTLGHCMLSRPFLIQFFAFRHPQFPDSLRYIILSSRRTLTTWFDLFSFSRAIQSTAFSHHSPAKCKFILRICNKNRKSLYSYY